MNGFKQHDMWNPETNSHIFTLMYEFYKHTNVGGKWLYVVMKYADDAFVITAYLTDRPKTGEQLWSKK